MDNVSTSDSGVGKGSDVVRACVYRGNGGHDHDYHGNQIVLLGTGTNTEVWRSRNRE